MTRSNNTGSVILPLVLAISLIINLVAGYTFLQNKQKQYFLVTNVVDGDTIDIEGGIRIRILGINASDQ